MKLLLAVMEIAALPKGLQLLAMSFKINFWWA
jgi:hypothetical protein